MISGKVVIMNETGLHVRPGHELVIMVKNFKSSIEFENEDGKRVRGNSLLKILSLGLKKGREIRVYADGEDEAEAVKKIVNFMQNLKD